MIINNTLAIAEAEVRLPGTIQQTQERARNLFRARREAECGIEPLLRGEEKDYRDVIVAKEREGHDKIRYALHDAKGKMRLAAEAEAKRKQEAAKAAQFEDLVLKEFEAERWRQGEPERQRQAKIAAARNREADTEARGKLEREASLRREGEAKREAEARQLLTRLWKAAREAVAEEAERQRQAEFQRQVQAEVARQLAHLLPVAAVGIPVPSAPPAPGNLYSDPTETTTEGDNDWNNPEPPGCRSVRKLARRFESN